MAEYALACEVRIPGVQPHGPGWYLVSVNTRVEAGPFLSPCCARAAATWLDDQARGVNPAPWHPAYSGSGLVIGSRLRLRRVPLQNVSPEQAAVG